MHYCSVLTGVIYDLIKCCDPFKHLLLSKTQVFFSSYPTFIVFPSLKLVLEHSLERTITLASLFLGKFAKLTST